MPQSIPQEAFRAALSRLGVGDAKVLVIISDMLAFGNVEAGALPGNDPLGECLHCIRAVMPPDGTIVVPTFTYIRTGGGSPYIHETTPSETGALTEYIRQQPGSVRSLHPVFSFAAIGPAGDRICGNASRHSYGWNSPVHRLVEEDALVLCLGRSPHRGTFFLHFAEVIAGVPYRYTKQLSIPVWVNGEEVRQPFFHFVKYGAADIDWDTNRFVDRMESQGILKYEPIGVSGMWSYRGKAALDTVARLLTRNPFSLLGHVPQQSPWNT